MAIFTGQLPPEWKKQKQFKCVVRNGKVILSERAKHYTLSNSPEAIRSRYNFAFISKFVKNLRSILQINNIWQTRFPGEKNLSNRLREVIPGLDEERIPSTANILTPRDGFELSALKADLTISRLKLFINPPGHFPRKLRRKQLKYAVKGHPLFL